VPQPEILQWHVTWSTRGRLPVAPDEARRRAIVRAIVGRARDWLVLFAVVDDHVHVWLLGEYEAMARVLRSLEFALRALAAAPLAARHVEPVESRSHATRLVPYLLSQPDHHAIGAPAATWSGTSAADLLGARDIGGWRSRVWDALPRLRLRVVHSAIGLPEVPLVPAPDGVVAARGVDRLVGTSAAALAAPPDLDGRADECLTALGAAAHLAAHAGFLQRDLANAVGRSREAVNRATARDVPAAVIRTVRLRIALEVAAESAVVGAAAAAEQR
jgi:hypothetical protein